MLTSSNTLWQTLVSYVPLGSYIDRNGLYRIVQEKLELSPDDLIQSAPGGLSRWQQKFNEVLERKREIGEILSDGRGGFKIDRPYVWRMIKEAVWSQEAGISYTGIKEYIDQRWPGVNSDTITAQIIVLTVNHTSRIHYPENHKIRLTNSGSPYDLLYRTMSGLVVKYNESKHGLWEIARTDENPLLVRQVASNSDHHIYTPNDISWFKSVKNLSDEGAYLNPEQTEFVLHFPTRHQRNVLSPAVGEILLIYQVLDKIPAFTHLVTPIDNELVEDSLRPRYQFGRRVKVIARTGRNSYIPVAKTLWSRIRLNGVIQGNACNIANIDHIENIDELKEDTWRMFEQHFLSGEQRSLLNTNALMAELNLTNPELRVKEGRLRLVSHLARERNPRIVREKKRLATIAGTLHCEVCTFSFVNTFQSNYIECHHKIPISIAGVGEISVDDLALVCANCHRMLHTKFEGQFLSIEELREHRQRILGFGS